MVHGEGRLANDAGRQVMADGAAEVQKATTSMRNRQGRPRWDSGKSRLEKACVRESESTAATGREI